MQCFINYSLMIANKMLSLLLQKAKVWLNCLKKLTSSLSKIWENTDGCADQYICASSLYLMSFLSQCYSIIIDRGISAPGHGNRWLMVLMPFTKCYMYQLMSNVQLPVSKTFDSQILMHYCTPKKDVSLAKEFQKHLSRNDSKHGVIDQGNTGKDPVKENRRKEIIMFRIIVMFHTKIWKCIVIQTNSQHQNFVIHIQSLMEQGGWVIIIVYILIQI